MNQKNTIDVSVVVLESMDLHYANGTDTTPQRAMRLMRRAMRTMGTKIPSDYCAWKAKYPELLIKDNS